MEQYVDDEYKTKEKPIEKNFMMMMMFILCCFIIGLIIYVNCKL